MKIDQIQLVISRELRDSEWDDFVINTPGGHHVQTSLWAQVKACLGWEPVRLIIKDNQKIIAGAQILFHKYPVLGTASYVTRGPLLSSEDSDLAIYLLAEIMKECRNRHTRLLAIQPPNNGGYLTSILEKHEFRLSKLELAPVASILIDLEPSEEQILGQMKRQTRQNVRKSGREGIVTREGTEDDLPAFYQMHLQTSKRQEFIPYTFEYFQTMWRAFRPYDFIHLIIAEFNGEPVSAMILFSFQDTVIAKILGWSGNYREKKVNEGLAWGCISWARAHGFRWFDFEGIDQDAARLMADGTGLTEAMMKTPNFFKYGFGGKVVFNPPAYETFPNKTLRWVYDRLHFTVANRSIPSKLLDILRKR